MQVETGFAAHMKKFALMILEDDVVTSVSLSRALQSELPDIDIHRASTVQEARLLLDAFDLDFFVLDVHVPDGCGIDFIIDITGKNPLAGVVIMTADAVPSMRDRATAFGILHFFEKPVHPRALAQIVRAHRSASPAFEGRKDTSFAGSLTRLTVLDVVQLKCLGRATLRLDFTLSDGRHGSIHFREGEIIHAEAMAGDGSDQVEGMSALSRILAWRGGSIHEVKSGELPPATLEAPWQGLLLEAAQRADEGARGP